MGKVWIINQYASTPDTGIGGRHYYLSRALAARGHEVTVIAARWHHLLRDQRAAAAAASVEERDGYRFVRVPVPRYAHAHDKRRVLNWLLFGRRLRHLPGRLGESPDTILYSSPSLLGFSGAERLARKTGARLVFEVRDIWPLTLEEVGGQSPRHPLMVWMQRVEDRAYRVSDAVVSNLPNAVDHMTTRGMDRAKFTWVPNGFDRGEVETPEPLSDAAADTLPKGKFLVGYTGTIGAANALETMVEAAARLEDHEDIAFVIVGSGRARDSIAADIARRGLRNILVIDPIPKRQVQSMLARFDACYIGLTHDSLFRFGVSPNKLFDYLVSGTPILYGIDSGRYRPVEELRAGLQIQPQDPAALADAVLKLKALPEAERAAMGARGRRAALETHEYGALARRLEEVLFPEGAS
ncbi:glycosyltransferase family 4 protein [Roseovarius sp. SCSIO 43702]|uniref:glycosyltransferase family 4 protein n=1 Tax=Roseovarius sp. SCSIO 43702 TaxID=2823043 RepID=UPI001C73A1FA|nr:glycosyltransferase family 4 protein [Roseovarius sp. SCSIO 43702]QYX56782.1 glycosyltransferase family 4 protein [Roseovarius sp. SCSIO 43702]